MKTPLLTTGLCGIFALLGTAACAQWTPEPTSAEPAARPGSTQAASAVEPPKDSPAPIVLVVVIDQLPSWALERYLPELPEDGFIRRAASEGAFHPRIRFSHGGTYTAAGHAAIATGGVPADTRIWSNYVYNREQKRALPIVDDGEHPVLGHEGAFASPNMIAAPTVGDALHEATGGRAIVASLSQKGRAAIVLGGAHADLVLWYEDDIPGYTTSTYYASEIPVFLDQWQRNNPIESILQVWKPLHPERYEMLLGPDAGSGEGDLAGYGRTFPHDPKVTEQPYGIVRASPHATPRLLALASETAHHLKMGTDDVPDLLWVSVSCVDYVGHIFGPQSWEYLDALIRVDRELDRFIATLGERAPLRVLLTSDHGVSPLPERLEEEGHDAGRLFPEKARDAAEQAADAVLGSGDWVEAFVPPFVYLSNAAKNHAERDRLTQEMTARLEAMQSVHGAYDVRRAARERNSDDPLKRAVANSLAADAPGDIFVVPAKHYVFDEGFPGGHGTSHGTPWDYDREVPVLMWGDGIGIASSSEPLAASRVAATVSALLGVQPPKHARAEPLPGTTQ